MKTGPRNKTALLVFVALAIVLFSSSALAIGITPSKRAFEFSPGQTVKYGIDIVNNGHEELEVILYPKGEFTDRVKLSQQMLKMGAEDDMKHVEVEFTMPERLDVAGEHVIEIVAVGSTPTPESAGAVVKADIAVVSKLVVEVPYPEKYAEARIHVLDTEVGKPVTVSVPVFNKGKLDINEAYAEIEIISSDGEKIAEASTQKSSIRSGDQFKFVAQTDEGLLPGSYNAVATVYYDGKDIKVETGFSVGELAIEIKSLVVDSFTLGDVAKFDILLQNLWSTELTNVYAEMQITGQDNRVYTDFRTVAVNIPARGIGRLEGYWYTQDVMPGIYTATVTLHYANRVSQKVFELEVYPNRIVAREVDALTGKAISAPEELDLQNNAFLILIIAVMGVVIGVLAYKLRKRKKDKGELPAKETVQETAFVQEKQDSQEGAGKDG